MTTYLVWILIAVSGGTYNAGTVTQIANFKTLEECQHVLKNIPSSNLSARCIQAEIVK